ncbi:MAG TPA: DUF433 domain-containing protein [Fimbriimonas sp.]|nr:DUF433 domain-containing protein [Fimbriimonas sp.]
MSVDPEILGGTPCFNGTRVPLDTVVDNLATGLSVDEMVDHFPTLKREHILAVLQWEQGLARHAAGIAVLR